MFYAHTLPQRPESEWELLETHLGAVGDLASQFADSIGAAEWGKLLGAWHDLGKYSAEFQAYLRSSTTVDDRESALENKVDHSTAGAQHATSRCGTFVGRLLAYCISGHHGGLPDNIDPAGGQSGLADRLRKNVCSYNAAPRSTLDLACPSSQPLTLDDSAEVRAFQLSILCRMLFSCLVDGDYLATEGFMRPARATDRERPVVRPAQLAAHLDVHIERLMHGAANSPVNRARAGVLAQCRAKAEFPPGLFSLTVPTGGGKTLSSLAFALRHAARHDLRRVIYAIPFTSIIEQNAKVFRQALAEAGPDVVLEHHSNFEPPAGAAATYSEAQTPWYRLAAENWDASLVVTTNVQLLESLFANKPSRCRKLHRIARSVIILDECQTLPVTLLEPTLRMLAELCRNYGCTVVLCSATQPAVKYREGFRIGLHEVREIVESPAELYESLRRVRVTQLGKLDDDALDAELRTHAQVLCVVNTRAHAAKLFVSLSQLVDSHERVFHLSAQMCPAHRTRVLNQIRRRLDSVNPRPCRVISTQLIEAGVDVDFPVVFRAMAGIDSIAQAAGRCNREGRHARGDVFVFDTDVKPTHDVKRAAQLAAEVAGAHEDLLSLDAIEHFFNLNYWSRQDEWDKEQILACFSVGATGPHFQFREAAEKYRLIRDEQQPIIVPYGARGRRLVAQLRSISEPPDRQFDRQLQRFAVGVYDRQFNDLRENSVIGLYHERFWVLENDEAYDDDLGLRTDAVGLDVASLCI